MEQVRTFAVRARTGRRSGTFGKHVPITFDVHSLFDRRIKC